jgi:hypothetical protein
MPQLRVQSCLPNEPADVSGLSLGAFPISTPQSFSPRRDRTVPSTHRRTSRADKSRQRDLRHDAVLLSDWFVRVLAMCADVGQHPVLLHPEHAEVNSLRR